MEPFQLDPNNGITIFSEEAKNVIFALGNLLHPPFILRADFRGDPPHTKIHLFYSYKTICDSPKNKWGTGPRIGSIPLPLQAANLPLIDQLKTALNEAFGQQAQKRMRAILTIARLKQDKMEWFCADLYISDTCPYGLLKNSSCPPLGAVKLIEQSSLNFHKFLGNACTLDCESFSEPTILSRPRKARPPFKTTQERMESIKEMLEAFQEEGADIRPWIADLLE